MKTCKTLNHQLYDGDICLELLQRLKSQIKLQQSKAKVHIC